MEGLGSRELLTTPQPTELAEEQMTIIQALTPAHRKIFQCIRAEQEHGGNQICKKINEAISAERNQEVNQAHQKLYMLQNGKLEARDNKGT